VNLLANPIVVRMAVVFVVALLALVIAWVAIRSLRQHLIPSAQEPVRTDAGAFPVAAYSAVIQKLKEKEEELERLRQQASTRAQATETASSAVLSNLASGVVLFTPAGLVQQANRAAREILGYASISGLSARDLFRTAGPLQYPPALGAGIDEHAGDIGSLAEAVELSIRQGRTFRRLESSYTTPAGEPRVLGVTVSPVLGAYGEKLGGACLISDLTEITELGRQVQMRKSMAALGEMSAGIAHEFKNSLATISGYSQMLASESDLDTVHSFASRIGSETQALTRIVTDFLNFARPQALCNQPLDLAEMFQHIAGEHQVELHLDAAQIPRCLYGDPTALTQAFVNLFRNSVQAAHGCPVRVDISARTITGQVQILYRDNAGGIPAEVLPKIFIPFFTTKPDGTGLGLALVHRIITQHGGAISATNDGPGAAFTFSLPLRNGRSASAEAG
jgi:signal transduction histidine kinase